MKKIIAIALLVASSVASAYYQPQCQQKYVCGPAGCQWVTVCW